VKLGCSEPSTAEALELAFTTFNRTGADDRRAETRFYSTYSDAIGEHPRRKNPLATFVYNMMQASSNRTVWGESLRCTVRTSYGLAFLQRWRRCKRIYQQHESARKFSCEELRKAYEEAVESDPRGRLQTLRRGSTREGLLEASRLFFITSPQILLSPTAQKAILGLQLRSDYDFELYIHTGLN